MKTRITGPSFGAECCTFSTHVPGEHRDRRVSFLKAVSTGASKHLSQVEGLPGKEDFAPRGYMTRCCRDYHRQAAVASHRPDTDLPMTALLSQGDALAKILSLDAGFSHREPGLRQAAAAARRNVSDF